MKTTQKQFWDAFKAIAKGRNRFQLKLRLGSWVLIRQKNGNGCPISAVANRLLHRHKFNSNGAFIAADVIGLDRRFALDLVRAADRNQFIIESEASKLRVKMLKIAGLKE